MCIKLCLQLKHPPSVEVLLLSVGFISKETVANKPPAILISDGAGGEIKDGASADMVRNSHAGKATAGRREFALGKEESNQVVKH